MLFKEVIPINSKMWINTLLNTFIPKLYLKKSIKFVLNSYYTLANMLHKLPFYIVSLFLFFIVHHQVYTQISGSKDPIVLNHADLMEGKETASGPIRELKGNVSISQGNVTLSCSHAIEYIQQNLVELSGDVILKQGSLTLSTPFAMYDGNSQLAKGRSGVKIVDRGKTVIAQTGDYSTSEYIARFYGNVSVEDDSALIYADTVYYERDSRNSSAFGHVSVLGKRNSAIIEGDTAYSINQAGITRILGKPVLFLIDSTKVNSEEPILHKKEEEKKVIIQVPKKSKGKQKSLPISKEIGIEKKSLSIQKMKYDTMTIEGDTLEVYRSSQDIFKALGNVSIARSGLAAIAKIALFLPKQDSLLLQGAPIVWYDSTRLQADTIHIHIKDKKVQKIDAQINAFALMSDDTIRRDRSQQLSGKYIEVNIVKDSIHSIIASKESKSLYFKVDEQGNPDGAARNTSDSIKVMFVKGEIDKIVWIGGVQGDVYPEYIIEKHIQDYDLPGKPTFIERPKKKVRRNTRNSRI